MDSFHHARILAVPSVEELRTHVAAAGEVYCDASERLSIDQVRAVRDWITSTAADSTGKQVWLFFLSATPEAQNALLKELEEPPAGVSFVLGTPEPAQLLPTLRSRLATQTTAAVNATNEAMQQFRALSLAERMEAVATHAKAKDHPWLDAIAQGVIELAGSSSTPALRELAVALDRYWSLPGTAKKMWLEHAALLLPTTKQQ